MDNGILSKESQPEEKESTEEIEALEFMTDSLLLWDKYDSLNMEEHNDDAQ